VQIGVAIISNNFARQIFFALVNLLEAWPKKGWTDVLLNTVCLSNTRGHPDTAFPI